MMQVLLDTNVLLWYFWGSDRVNTVKDLISSDEVDVFYSVVSLWEMAIKTRAGKLDIDLDKLSSIFKKYQFNELPITGNCIKAYLELPHLHKDPFDHILLAQAITHPMRLITSDSTLADYSSLVMAI